MTSDCGPRTKAYGARAAQRRDAGVVSLRVEREGALDEIDVALRDVRGLADDAEAFAATPIGTGPYAVTSYTEGVELVVQANPEHADDVIVLVTLCRNVQ